MNRAVSVPWRRRRHRRSRGRLAAGSARRAHRDPGGGEHPDHLPPGGHPSAERAMTRGGQLASRPTGSGSASGLTAAHDLGQHPAGLGLPDPGCLPPSHGDERRRAGSLAKRWRRLGRAEVVVELRARATTTGRGSSPWAGDLLRGRAMQRRGQQDDALDGVIAAVLQGAVRCRTTSPPATGAGRAPRGDEVHRRAPHRRPRHDRRRTRPRSCRAGDVVPRVLNRSTAPGRRAPGSRAAALRMMCESMNPPAVGSGCRVTSVATGSALERQGQLADQGEPVQGVRARCPHGEQAAAPVRGSPCLRRSSSSRGVPCVPAVSARSRGVAEHVVRAPHDRGARRRGSHGRGRSRGRCRSSAALIAETGCTVHSTPRRACGASSRRGSRSMESSPAGLGAAAVGPRHPAQYQPTRLANAPKRRRGCRSGRLM